MKRRILSLILTLVLAFGLSTTAGAYTNKQLRAADALNHLDLFRGTGLGYELDKGLPREQGPILILRVIGKEAEAKLTDPTENPFVDISARHWGIRELTYANKVGLIKGSMNLDGELVYEPAKTMEEYMFLTLLLRQLGYLDNTISNGAPYDFIWNKPYELAKELGIVDSVSSDGDFTRGDAAFLSWRAMEATFKGTDETLADRLMDEGVFTTAEYAEAKEIWTYGAIRDDDSGYTSSTPTTPSTSSTPDNGDVGSDDGCSNNENTGVTSGDFGAGRV